MFQIRHSFLMKTTQYQEHLRLILVMLSCHHPKSYLQMTKMTNTL